VVTPALNDLSNQQHSLDGTDDAKSKQEKGEKADDRDSYLAVRGSRFEDSRIQRSGIHGLRFGISD
jgi:hypothetical protein